MKYLLSIVLLLCVLGGPSVLHAQWQEDRWIMEIMNKEVSDLEWDEVDRLLSHRDAVNPDKRLNAENGYWPEAMRQKVMSWKEAHPEYWKVQPVEYREFMTDYVRALFNLATEEDKNPQSAANRKLQNKYFKVLADEITAQMRAEIKPVQVWLRKDTFRNNRPGQRYLQMEGTRILENKKRVKVEIGPAYHWSLWWELSLSMEKRMPERARAWRRYGLEHFEQGEDLITEIRNALVDETYSMAFKKQFFQRFLDQTELTPYQMEYLSKELEESNELTSMLMTELFSIKEIEARQMASVRRLLLKYKPGESQRSNVMTRAIDSLKQGEIVKYRDMRAYVDAVLMQPEWYEHRLSDEDRKALLAHFENPDEQMMRYAMWLILTDTDKSFREEALKQFAARSMQRLARKDLYKEMAERSQRRGFSYQELVGLPLVAFADVDVSEALKGKNWLEHITTFSDRRFAVGLRDLNTGRSSIQADVMAMFSLINQSSTHRELAYLNVQQPEYNENDDEATMKAKEAQYQKYNFYHSIGTDAGFYGRLISLDAVRNRYSPYFLQFAGTGKIMNSFGSIGYKEFQAWQKDKPEDMEEWVLSSLVQMYDESPEMDALLGEQEKRILSFEQAGKEALPHSYELRRNLIEMMWRYTMRHPGKPMKSPTLRKVIPVWLQHLEQLEAGEIESEYFLGDHQSVELAYLYYRCFGDQKSFLALMDKKLPWALSMKLPDPNATTRPSTQPNRKGNPEEQLKAMLTWLPLLIEVDPGNKMVMQIIQKIESFDKEFPNRIMRFARWQRGVMLGEQPKFPEIMDYTILYLSPGFEFYLATMRDHPKKFLPYYDQLRDPRALRRIGKFEGDSGRSLPRGIGGPRFLMWVGTLDRLRYEKFKEGDKG